MIYFCADDYGLSASASRRIKQCVDEGKLDTVSVLPNFDSVDLHEITENKNVRLSLHLNLVEGKCMADADEIGLLADNNGNFKHTFAGLLSLSVFQGKKFETQVYKEIKTQVLFWKNILPKDAFFCVDSHQHTHMIPAVFKALLKVIRDENIEIHHMRIPSEPLLPFVKTPSLYFTYSIVNIIKQWLLKFLWMIDKNHLKDLKIPTSHFFGILFSGKMDERKVSEILPKYIKMAEKDGSNVEVLFHPGYLEDSDTCLTKHNITFKKFYLSENRKTEFDSVMKIPERSRK